MKRARSHWPAVIWASVMIVAPIIVHLFGGWQPPTQLATPIGIASPAFAALWRIAQR